MSKISELVEEKIAPIVESCGCEIVEVEFAKKSNGDNLTVFIDKPGGVCLEDCEKVHTAIDAPLDDLDPTSGKPYTLNVSSPGIDRPIKTTKDFARNVGETLEVHLYQAIQKNKTFVGMLVGVSEESIILKLSDDENIELERSAISKATKYIDF